MCNRAIQTYVCNYTCFSMHYMHINIDPNPA